MSRATIKRLEKMLAPHDGMTREIVGLIETEGGHRCETCGALHATVEDAKRAHPGPGILFLMIRVVGADKKPISGASPG